MSILVTCRLFCFPFFCVLFYPFIGFFWPAGTGAVFVKRQFIKLRVFGNAVHKCPAGLYFIAADKQALVAFHKIQKQALVSAGNFPGKSLVVAKLQVPLVQLMPKPGILLLICKCTLSSGWIWKVKTLAAAAFKQTADRLAKMDAEISVSFLLNFLPVRK